jgi:hypothetical protein
MLWREGTLGRCHEADCNEKMEFNTERPASNVILLDDDCNQTIIEGSCFFLSVGPIQKLVVSVYLLRAIKTIRNCSVWSTTPKGRYNRNNYMFMFSCHLLLYGTAPFLLHCLRDWHWLRITSFIFWIVAWQVAKAWWCLCRVPHRFFWCSCNLICMIYNAKSVSFKTFLC